MSSRTSGSLRRSRQRTLVVAAVLLLVGAGAIYLVPRSAHKGERAPARLRATDFVREPVVPLSEIPWPPVPAASKSALSGAIASIRRALALYSQAERHATAKPPEISLSRQIGASADAAMKEGLDRLESLGALVSQLGPYHMRTVETALAARDLPAARARLASWLVRSPDDYDHRLELGKVDFQLIRWADSAASLRRAASLRPASLEARFWLAEVCHRMGARDEGVKATREGLDLLGFPSGESWSHPMGKMFLGNSIKVLHRFREYGLLAEVASLYRRHEPEAIEATMAEGVALVHVGRYAAAEPLLRRALSDPSNREEVLFTLGLAQAKQSKWKEAAGSFSSLLAEHPFFVRAYYQLGLSLSRLGRDSQADVLFARSRDLAGSERELRRERELEGVGQPGRAAVARSRAYRLRGQYDLAETALRKRELRENPFAVLALAELYIDTLRASEAERVLDHTRTLISPNHADLQGNRARILFTRGSEANALGVLRQLVARPGAGKVWRLTLARLLIEAGRFDEAIRVLKVTDDPDGEIGYQLGRAFLRGGQPAEALEALRTISRGDKRWQSWRGDLWMAWALAAGSQDERSIESATGLLGRAPGSERRLRVYLEARLALLERSSGPAGDTEALRAALARYDGTRARVRSLKIQIARSTWPASGPRYLTLATVLAERGEAREAIRFARLAAIATPKSPEPLAALAAWLTDPGDVFSRLRVLRDLSARRPGNAAIRDELRKLREEWLRF